MRYPRPADVDIFLENLGDPEAQTTNQVAYVSKQRHSFVNIMSMWK